MVILGGGIALSNLEIFDMKYLFGFFKFAAQPDAHVAARLDARL